MYSMYRHSTYS